MSGHSKWNNIKRKKEKTDGARAKVFTKIGREISVAVKEGGGNPASNSKLAALIAKAKANSVPNDNIQRIIKRAEGRERLVRADPEMIARARSLLARYEELWRARVARLDDLLAAPTAPPSAPKSGE